MKARHETNFGTIFQPWALKPLAEVAFFQEGPGLRKWQWTESGMKVINVTNILGDGSVDVNNTTRFISSEEFESKYRHFAVDAGDIVVASSGNTYGKVGRVNHSHLPIMMNTSVIRFHPADSEKLDQNFLYSFLRSHLFKNQMESYVIGSAQPNFGPSHLKRMVIPCPDLPTQRKIGGILSAYDDLIENNSRRIAILEEVAQRLYKEWFVNFRFPGHENAKFVDSPLGKIPEGWKVSTIGSVLEFHIGGGWGQDTTDDEHSNAAFVIRGTDIPNARSLRVENCPQRFHTDSNIRTRKLLANDLVFEVSGGSKDQPVGRCLFISDRLLHRFDGDVICASFCKLIRANPSQLAPELLYHYLTDSYTNGTIERYEVQSTGIKNFKFTVFLESESLAVPPAKVQEMFVFQVRPLMDAIHVLGKKTEVLRSTRDLLLPKLISGQLDVEDLDIDTLEPLVDA